MSLDWNKVKKSQEIRTDLQMLGVFPCADYLRGRVCGLWLYRDLLPQMRPEYTRIALSNLQDVRADKEAS